MRVLLTSAGLETKEIRNHFMKMLHMDPAQAKALFVPTAAIYADAVMVLPKCMNDLLKCGIPASNIAVYDLHACITFEELQKYDVVYICGGDPGYLMQRINDTGFEKVLMQYIFESGMVLGVSAGSLIFARNQPGHLNLLDIDLYVHCATSDEIGKLTIPLTSAIKLNGKRSLAIYDTQHMEIIG